MVVLEDDLAAEERGNTAYEAFREHRRKHDPRRLGGTPKPYSPPEIPQGEVNVTDPDSRRMMGNRRYIHGYNAQAVVTVFQGMLEGPVDLTKGQVGCRKHRIRSSAVVSEEGPINAVST